MSDGCSRYARPIPKFIHLIEDIAFTSVLSKVSEISLVLFFEVLLGLVMEKIID